MSLYLGTTPIASDGSHRLPGEIGDIGIAPFGIDESLNLRRYLNGQVISQTQFESFTNKVKSAIALYPNLSATEESWQAEVTASVLGQCGKFVIDDEAGTIRLPKVVNIQGLQDLALIGGIKAESLPDAIYYSDVAWNKAAGDASRSLVASKGGYENNNTGKGLLVGDRQDSTSTFDYSYGKLSASNSTYQNNAPVQQEAVQYPYYIQVATGVEETLPAIREYKVNNSNFFGQSMWSDIEPNNASLLASNGQYNTRVMYPDYYNWLLGMYNNPTESNVIKVGSIVDDNGVLSGFGSTSWVTLPSNFSPNSSNWEIFFKFTTGTIGTIQDIICSQLEYQPVGVVIETDGCLLFEGYLNNTSTQIFNIKGTTILESDTTYYVKCEYDSNTGYSLKLGTDKDNLVLEGNSAVTTVINSGYNIALGCDFTTNGAYYGYAFTGSIDLNESYININGQRWWNGRKSAVVKTGETSISFNRDFVINMADETFRLPLSNGERVLVAKKEATTTDPSWWNWYSDGWLEQGGQIKSNGTNYWATVTYLKPFKEEPTVLITMKGCYYNAAIYGQHGINAQTSTSTAFTTLMDNSNIPYKNWEASGYAEIPTEIDYTEIKGLYYYVGDVVQDASLINAGRVLEYFSKLNTVHCVIETFKSGTSWYRVYDDGWVEQGATISLTACPQTITLLKQYQDNNYTICIGGGDPDSNAAVCSTSVYSRAVGSFSLASGYNGTFYSCVISWFACGYGA